MTNTPNAVDVFDYTDYRVFLRDWLAEAKKRRGYSLRVFASRAGLGSQGYLKMVMDGKRNLGESGLERFMNGIRLAGERRLYFRHLVLSNQAETEEEKAKHEGRLGLLRRCRKLVPHIRERIARFREEISSLLTADFTREEAEQLARQLLSTE